MASRTQQKGRNGGPEERSLSAISTASLHRKLAMKFPRVFKIKTNRISQGIPQMAPQTLPYKPRSRSGPPTTFLSLPVELRIQIYSYLSASHNSLTRPSSHPYLKMFIIHPTIRLDLLELFFKTPTFSFFTAASCLAFLRVATSHTHLLTTLTLYLYSTETHLLELICEELFTRKAPLRHLNIHLGNVGLYDVPIKRVVTAYMIPRRIGVSEKGRQASAEMRRPPSLPNAVYWAAQDEPYGMRLRYPDYFEYTMEHMPIALDAVGSHDSFISRFDTLRYMVVRGQPEDEADGKGPNVRAIVEGKLGKFGFRNRSATSWTSLDFELAILKLHLKMQVVADTEGRKLRVEGSDDPEDRRWYYEAFIDGEELDAPRYW